MRGARIVGGANGGEISSSWNINIQSLQGGPGCTKRIAVVHQVDIAVWPLPLICAPDRSACRPARVGRDGQNAQRRADKRGRTLMSSGKQISNTFTQEEGDIHIGGIEALVRLTMDQVRFDPRRGLNNAMFVSGYRGSPVGMLDADFIKQQKLLVQNQHPVRRRHQRGPRRHRRLGHPDAAHRRQPEVRRRHRHLVRQGAGRGPLG